MNFKSALRPYLIPAAVMFVVGWGGLLLLLNVTEPFLWPRWLFYFLLVMAGTGTALPFAWFFNTRFPSTPPAGSNVIVRQGIWFGVYLALLAWLEMGNILSFVLGVAIGGGIVAIEFFIRMRENAQKPVTQAEEPEPGPAPVPAGPAASPPPRRPPSINRVNAAPVPPPDNQANPPDA